MHNLVNRYHQNYFTLEKLGTGFGFLLFSGSSDETWLLIFFISTTYTEIKCMYVLCDKSDYQSGGWVFVDICKHVID